MTTSELDQSETIRRRSAQAMAATYVQMLRHAELARALHAARARATQRRLERASDPEEAARLTRQLGAQEQQGASIEHAVTRFRRNVDNLEAFRDAGLTAEDFKALGLEELLKPKAEAAPPVEPPPVDPFGDVPEESGSAE